MVVDFPQQSDEVTQAMLAGWRQILNPQKVYVLGVQEVHDGTPPTDLDYAGWHYLALLAPDTGLAHRVSQQTGQPAIFAGLSFGRQAAGALQASQQIANLPGVPDGAYEARMLSVPGLLTESFWLKATPPASDVVVAYDSNAPGVQLMYPYSMAQFLQILKPLALARLRFAATLSRSSTPEKSST
jgi:hypothetical protein